MSKSRRDEMIVEAMDAIEKEIDCGEASDVFLMAASVVDALLARYKIKPRPPREGT